MADETPPDQTPAPPDPAAPSSGAGPVDHHVADTGGSDHGGPDRDIPERDIPNQDGPNQDGPEAPHRLRRDLQHQMLGGVAAGMSRYLGVDVVFVRVAFAVLTVFGGSGALIYLAAWVLIPADDQERPLAQQWADRHPPRRSLVVIMVGVVLGLVALSDLFSSGPWWPHRQGGIGLALGAVALVLALTLVAGSGGARTATSRLRWLFVMIVLGCVAVVVVAAATVFSIEAASGVPLRGGIGDTQFHPTSTGQLQPNYRLAMGNLNVDLSDVPFRTGTTHVTTSVGIGRLVVEVPPGPTVSVVAHSGLGVVQVFGQNNSGLSTVQTIQAGGAGEGARRHIVLDANAGVGQVQVIRTASALS
jgi:phage shock protein PspC (stress-responsive transcriptional regulator)